MTLPDSIRYTSCHADGAADGNDAFGILEHRPHHHRDRVGVEDRVGVGDQHVGWRAKSIPQLTASARPPFALRTRVIAWAPVDWYSRTPARTRRGREAREHGHSPYARRPHGRCRRSTHRRRSRSRTRVALGEKRLHRLEHDPVARSRRARRSRRPVSAATRTPPRTTTSCAGAPSRVRPRRANGHSSRYDEVQSRRERDRDDPDHGQSGSHTPALMASAAWRRWGPASGSEPASIVIRARSPTACAPRPRRPRDSRPGRRGSGTGRSRSRRRGQAPGPPTRAPGTPGQAGPARPMAWRRRRPAGPAPRMPVRGRCRPCRPAAAAAARCRRGCRAGRAAPPRRRGYAASESVEQLADRPAGRTCRSRAARRSPPHAAPSPWTQRVQERDACLARSQPAEASRGGEPDVRVAVVERLQQRHLGARAAHVAEQSGVLGADMGVNRAQPFRRPLHRSTLLEEGSDCRARLAHEHRRQARQGLGERRLVRSSDRLGRVSIDQREGHRLDPQPGLLALPFPLARTRTSHQQSSAEQHGQRRDDE